LVSISNSVQGDGRFDPRGFGLNSISEKSGNFGYWQAMLWVWLCCDYFQSILFLSYGLNLPCSFSYSLVVCLIAYC